MSAYSDLAGLAIFRPIPVGTMRRLGDRKTSTYSASWSSTVDLLERELRLVGAIDVIVELDMDESQFRRDGLPRADARAKSPNVVLQFTLAQHGEIRYEVDTYDRWEDNIRALALSLEALRAVSRYGVAKGQQYAGWKALGAAPAPSAERGGALVELFGSLANALFKTAPDTRDDGYSDADYRDVIAYKESR